MCFFVVVAPLLYDKIRAIVELNIFDHIKIKCGMNSIRKNQES